MERTSSSTMDTMETDMSFYRTELELVEELDDDFLPRYLRPGQEREVQDLRTLLPRICWAVAVITLVLYLIGTLVFNSLFKPELLMEFKEIEFKDFKLVPMVDQTGIQTYHLQAQAMVQIDVFNPSVINNTRIKGISGFILFEERMQETHNSINLQRTIMSGQMSNFVVPKKSGLIVDMQLYPTGVNDDGFSMGLYGYGELMLKQLKEVGSIKLGLQLQLESEYLLFSGSMQKTYLTYIDGHIDIIPGTSTQSPKVIIYPMSYYNREI